MTELLELPLFPLNTVHFPGAVLPLRIFEERYKLMMNHCLEESRRFGVLLIREGSEVGGGAVPHEVGTTTEIVGLTRLSGGRMNIVTVGKERFRLHAVQTDQPYMVGHVAQWPLSGGSSERALGLAEPTRDLFRAYLDLLDRAQGEEVDIEELPTEPKPLALLIAATLRVAMPQKQRLLGQPSVADMLTLERAILRRERLILEHILRTQGEQWEGGHSGLLAKN